jgi:hypothetical protein
MARKAIAAYNSFPVKKNTMPATMTAGTKNSRAPTNMIIMIPIKMRTPTASMPSTAIPTLFKISEDNIVKQKSSDII